MDRFLAETLAAAAFFTTIAIAVALGIRAAEQMKARDMQGAVTP